VREREKCSQGSSIRILPKQEEDGPEQLHLLRKIHQLFWGKKERLPYLEDLTHKSQSCGTIDSHNNGGKVPSFLRGGRNRSSGKVIALLPDRSVKRLDRTGKVEVCEEWPFGARRCLRNRTDQTGGSFVSKEREIAP